MSGLERLNAYSEPTPSGGVRVDVEGLVRDTVFVFKVIGGHSKETFLEVMTEMWDKVGGSVTRDPTKMD